MSTALHELPIGEVIDARFRVLAYLGGGGFGEVYRMQDITLEREVVVKILRAEERRLPEARAEFIAEGRKQARLRDDANVVTIYEAGELRYRGEPFPYIVMECLHDGQLPVAKACRLGAELAGVLAVAEQNRIHREVKPLNTLLDAQGHAKLDDLGLAKVLERSRGVNNREAGTQAYMLSEQFSEGATTPQADIYALGCTLYHLLTGTPPFVGTQALVINAHLHTPAPALQDKLPEAPPALCRLLARMMAKEAGKRPTAVDVQEILTVLIGSQQPFPTKTGRPRQAWKVKKPVLFVLLGLSVIIATIFGPQLSYSLIPLGAHAGEEQTNQKDGATMVWVPAGDFQMGGADWDWIWNLSRRDGWWFTGEPAQDDEKPQHRVYLDGYWMYKNDVTIDQYRRFCRATGRKMPEAPYYGWIDDHATVNVSWFDAKAYADWAAANLPTAAQWEKASRGVDRRIYPWGNRWDNTKCANSYNSINGVPQEIIIQQGTRRVGSFPTGVSPYGCLDMVGNVCQFLLPTKFVVLRIKM